MFRRFDDFDFEYVMRIEPERDLAGHYIEQRPQAKYSNVRELPLNLHGAGPFCRFYIPSVWDSGGVYVVTTSGAIAYVGKCSTPLAERFGPRGYGVIHPRNCYLGGQSTNCRINSLILRHATLGNTLELWFRTESDKLARNRLESRLIQSLRPPWNIQRPFLVE